jgi:hypothetical protein
MAAATSQLDIVIQLQDLASQAIKGLSDNVKVSLDDIKAKANDVALTFGAAGAAILAPIGLMVDGAAKEQAQLESLKTTVQAAIDAAQGEAGSTSEITKQKKLLEGQLVSVNAKLDDYVAKSNTSKGATGEYTASIEKLQQQAQGLRDKLDGLNNQQSLVAGSTSQIVDQFKAAADANTNLGFEVEDSITSFNKLFAATGNVQESLTLNQLAMDLARKGNIDLATATTQVVLATEGNGRALKQYGINLKDGLTPMEAVSQLQDKLKDQAVAYTTTLSGQMEVTKAKTAELSDAIGSGLIPALTMALTTLTPIIQRLTEWIEAHPKLTTGILATVAGLGVFFLLVSAVAGAISATITIVEAITTAVSLFGTVLAFVAANPIVLIIAAIVALGVGIYLLITHWQQVSDFTKQVWNDIAGFVEKNWKAIIQILLPGMGSLLVFIVSNLGQIQSAWNLVWGGVSTFFIGIWDGIKNALTTALDFLKTTIQAFVSWATGIFQPILNAVSAVGNAASGFGKAIGGAVSSVIPHFATGGIVSSPTFALIGEAGPEAVIPLSAFSGGTSLSYAGASGGAGAAIIININGGNYLDSQGATMIANELAKQINRSIKLRNYAA